MGSHVTLAVVKFSSHAGDPDEQENRWVISSDLALPAWSDFGGGLETLYHAILDGRCSSELSDSAKPQWETYDITAHLDGSPHGSPFGMGSFATALSPAGQGLPAQDALVIDYHADLTGVVEFGVHARPRARRRGRHFHGPFAITQVTADATTNSAVWTSSLLTDVTGSYHTFLSTLPVGAEFDVWSRKDAAVYPVIGGWVDHTVRTRRSRVEPTGIKSFWS